MFFHCYPYCVRSSFYTATRQCRVGGTTRNKCDIYIYIYTSFPFEIYQSGFRKACSCRDRPFHLISWILLCMVLKIKSPLLSKREKNGVKISLRLCLMRRKNDEIEFFYNILFLVFIRIEYWDGLFISLKLLIFWERD